MGNRKCKITLLVLIFGMMPFVANAQKKSKNDTPQIAYRSLEEVAVSCNELNSVQRMCLDVVSSIDERSLDTAQVKEKPKYWTNGIMMQAGLSQVSLTNWAEGGSANISLNALVDANANYSKNKMIWENRLRMSYGFIQSFEKGTPSRDLYKKNDDKLQIDSKWGWMLVDKLYFSSILNFRTQFSNTIDGDGNLQSRFLAPGYASLGLGINYKPFDFLSLNLSPLTGNLVVVTVPTLMEVYGNKAGQVVRGEFGAQFKMDVKWGYKDFKISSGLTLFSDYLNNPQNIQVYWDVDASLKLSKIFTISLRTNLIYDDNIKIPDDNGVVAPRVQFKEVLSLALTYTIGQYIKPQ